MMGAYLLHAGATETEYGNGIFQIIRHWPVDELLSVLLKCDTENYADSWRIDTYDNPADGEVYLVPRYGDVLRELWINVMLEKGHVPSDPSYLVDKSLLENTVFFTEGRSEDQDNEIKKQIQEKKSPEGESLIKLVDEFRKIRYNWEAKKLASEPLDQSKVEKFRKLVNDAYNEASIAKEIFTRKENYLIEKSFKQKGFKRIGINQIFDKEAFIKEWHSGYITDMMASDVGRSTATQQDADIFMQLFGTFIEEGSFEKLAAALKLHSGEWFVIANGVNPWTVRHRMSEHVSMLSKNDNIYFKGISQKRPMKTIFTDKLPEGIYFVSVSELGRLIRKPHKYQNDEVEVLVDAYSENIKMLNSILKDPPQFLQAKGTKTEQRSHLLKKVRLVTDRVYRYIPPENPQVHFFRINEDI
jgi:hypothetical protein